MARRHVPLSERPTIARRRMAVGVDQGTFARMLGLSRPHYCQFETGRRPYPPRVAERADRVLVELEAATYRVQQLAAAPAGRVA